MGGGKIKDATALPSDVAKGKIFYNNQGRQIGDATILKTMQFVARKDPNITTKIGTSDVFYNQNINGYATIGNIEYEKVNRSVVSGVKCIGRPIFVKYNGITHPLPIVYNSLIAYYTFTNIDHSYYSFCVDFNTNFFYTNMQNNEVMEIYCL